MLPRRKRTWFQIAAGAGIVLVAYAVLMPTLSWSGAAPLQVRVTAIDAATGAPLSRVSLSVVNADGSGLGSTMNLPTDTDIQGHATVRTVAGAGGTRSFLYESASASAEMFAVQGTRPDYVTSVAPIKGEVRLGRIAFVHWGSRTIDVTLPMQRPPPPPLPTTLPATRTSGAITPAR